MSNLSTIISKINNKEVKVGIVGLGYVGLPLALAFASNSIETHGFDIDSGKIKLLNEGKIYFDHLDTNYSKSVINSDFFSVTADFSQIDVVDAIIICVPTPLGFHNEPDLSFITSTLSSISPYLRQGQIISLESTTYPGTTDEYIVPLIKDMGFDIGKNFYIVYSPEREDPGNPNFSTNTIPKVVGGYSKDCLHVGCELYKHVVNQVVPVSSLQVAEMTKLLENIHRAVNIGLVNELKQLADKMSIDIFEVIHAASTKPFGFTPYYPGPGLGGHCIPIDPFYLTWKAKEYGMNTKFIELAGEINTSMPEYVCSKITLALNNLSKSVFSARILVLGVSYKKNIDDLRESPSLHIIDLLMKLGANVDYSDPYFPKLPHTRQYKFNLTSVELLPNLIASYDVVLLCTDHDKFPYELILSQSPLIVDTRGRFEQSSKVIRA